MGKQARLKAAPKADLKLDLGCGIHKREGFTGVDRLSLDGVDQVVDLTKTPWPWKANSVAEAHSSHFIEHLTATQRVAFANELYRVLVPGGTCQIIVPHWANCRAYGDPTHQWPPVSEFWFYYLSRDWRKEHTPHTDIAHNPQGFDCHFEATWGYSMSPAIVSRNQEYQQFAMTNYKDAIFDLIATLKKA